MRRTYRYRIFPTRHQTAALEAQLGQACDFYNAALEHRKRMWRDYGESVGYGAQSAELRELRAAGLLDAESNFWSQQAVLRRLAPRPGKLAEVGFEPRQVGTAADR